MHGVTNNKNSRGRSVNDRATSGINPPMASCGFSRVRNTQSLSAPTDHVSQTTLLTVFAEEFPYMATARPKEPGPRHRLGAPVPAGNGRPAHDEIPLYPSNLEHPVRLSAFFLRDLNQRRYTNRRAAITATPTNSGTTKATESSWLGHPEG